MEQKKLKVIFVNNWNEEKEAVEKKIIPSNVKPGKKFILKSN